MADKTVTVRPSGGTYTSLAAAIAGEVAANANLVTMEGILNISIEGTWSSDDTTAVTVTGFTTNASYYVNIVTDSANRAGTSWSTSKYRLNATRALSILEISNRYTRISGLQITGTENGGNQVVYLNGADITVIDCFIKDTISAALYIDNSGIIINTIMIGVDFGFYNDGSVFLYNCTIIGSASFNGVSNVVKNCYWNGASGSGKIMTTCASADGSGSTGLQLIPYSTATFTNVTSGSEDLSLASGSSLIGVGTNLSADATYPFDWDITGGRR